MAQGTLLNDVIVRKLDIYRRFQYVQGPDEAEPRLSDMWLSAADLREAGAYDPDVDIEYHLFTRANPTVSQPLIMEDNQLTPGTHFDARKRTVILIHGWLSSVTSNMTTVLVPAFLQAADVNVIAVDWSAGASSRNYAVAALNCINSGREHD
ncbi:hypothetical protein JYU34_008073 [Plutella xylostella]|uniref:Lipase domain-containing protein n=1 Tax=Plutella xylostella TaxID=51655 RepID=A0ABQ7QNN6_PLUXY|nr:hypothetical protein JYU34_008073 [Plutella xylostella]